ncbi:unnamed protein product, partial [Musa acuminata var. zebrina]
REPSLLACAAFPSVVVAVSLLLLTSRLHLVSSKQPRRMALLHALAAFHVLAVLAVAYADRGGAPDEDIEAVITRADNKAADSSESELQVGGGHGQESGVDTRVKTLPDKIVVAGNPEGREVHLLLPGAGAALVAHRQAQRRGRNGSRGSGDVYDLFTPISSSIPITYEKEKLTLNSVSLDRMPEHLHTTLGVSGVTQPSNGETAIQVQTLLVRQLCNSMK